MNAIIIHVSNHFRLYFKACRAGVNFSFRNAFTPKILFFWLPNLKKKKKLWEDKYKLLLFLYFSTKMIVISFTEIQKNVLEKIIFLILIFCLAKFFWVSLNPRWWYLKYGTQWELAIWNWVSPSHSGEEGKLKDTEKKMHGLTHHLLFCESFKNYLF